MSSTTAPIRGTVDDAFRPVLDAFRTNLAERGELGAACAVVHRGDVVVDLWGGHRDVARREPWTADTLVLVFSTTKGVAATAMAHAHAAGLFDYDDRVADHWPAFAAAGKGDVTVRELLAHRAGLAAVEGTLTPARIADREGLMADLAAKRPDWPPGQRHGYHAWSLGFYESELLRRTDPEGRTLGRYVAEELADPLDVEFYVGLPDDVAEGRVADVEGFGMADLLTSVRSFPPRLLLALANPHSTASRALNPFDVGSPAELNDPAYRSLEVPAGTGVGRVRDLARLYGLLASDPGAVGLDDTAVAELTERPAPPPGGSTDAVLRTETSYAAGFWKPSGAFRFGSSAAFGAPGAGGSFAFADPERGLGFAYAPNRMGTHLWDDPRERALRDAALDCLDAV
jgi:CubicO group peptidase (beta-lactamase class C family)